MSWRERRDCKANGQREHGSAHMGVAATNFLLPPPFSSLVPFLGRSSQRELSYFWIVHGCQGHPGHLLLHFLMKAFLFPTALRTPEVGRALSAYHKQRFHPSVRHEAFFQPILSWEPIQDLLLTHRSGYENEFSFATHKCLFKWNCTIHPLNRINLMLELASGSQNQKGILGFKQSLQHLRGVRWSTFSNHNCLVTKPLK